MDLDGSPGALRIRSELRVRFKAMLKEGKVIEVEPGVFKVANWYREECEMYARLGAMRREETLEMLDNGCKSFAPSLADTADVPPEAP